MKSKEQCCDDRFEIINETKQYIINATNIETSPEEMNVLDSICFRLWQLGLTKRNKDKLKELTHQPALLECIKEWEALGYEFKIDKENKSLIILWNIKKLSRFEIDLEYKRVKCNHQIPSLIIYDTDRSFAYVDFKELYLLPKTLKALENNNETK